MQSVNIVLLTTLSMVAQSPRSELDGTWELVRIEIGGREIDPGTLNSRHIRFMKCDYEYIPLGQGASNREEFAEGTYETHPDQTPKGLDFIAKHPQSREYLRRGIYEIKADTLKFALAKPGQPRPKEFGPGLRVEIWKRGRPNPYGQGQGP